MIAYHPPGSVVEGGAIGAEILSPLKTPPLAAVFRIKTFTGLRFIYHEESTSQKEVDRCRLGSVEGWLGVKF